MKKAFIASTLALLIASSSCMAYTAEDVTAAAKDTAKLKVIATDAETDLPVKYAAAKLLPPDQAVAYLDAPWQSNGENLDAEYYFRDHLFMANVLPANQYARMAFMGANVANSHGFGGSYQRKLVEKLVAEGRVDEALGEARRLYGITAVTRYELTLAVNVIAGVLKAKALKDGQGLKAGIAAANQYLEAVQKGEESKHPFAAMAVPASPANIAVFEKSPDLRRAIWALLYAGKYDEANAKADAYLAAADGGSLMLAIDLKAMTLNGKAASPIAANAFLDSLK